MEGVVGEIVSYELYSVSLLTLSRSTRSPLCTSLTLIACGSRWMACPCRHPPMSCMPWLMPHFLRTELPGKCCATYYINNNSAGHKIKYPFSYIKNISLECRPGQDAGVEVRGATFPSISSFFWSFWVTSPSIPFRFGDHEQQVNSWAEAYLNLRRVMVVVMVDMGIGWSSMTWLPLYLFALSVFGG